MKNSLLVKEPFIFVRHGRTDWSMDKISQGPANLSLNSIGEQDAESVAGTLCMMANAEDVIISSELTRAMHTARIIAKKLKKPVNTFPDLHEHYFGDFRLIESSSGNNVPPDAESEKSFQDRINRAFFKLMNTGEFNGKRKIIVSHSLVFKYLSTVLTGKQESINFGEAFLFTPTPADWTIKKIHER